MAEAIKETIQSLLKEWESKKSKKTTDPQALLEKTLSKKEQEHARFSYFKRGQVVVDVDSSSWLYKLSLQKQNILAKLNKKSKAIKEIRFRIGEIR